MTRPHIHCINSDNNLHMQKYKTKTKHQTHTVYLHSQTIHANAFIINSPATENESHLL